MNLRRRMAVKSVEAEDFNNMVLSLKRRFNNTDIVMHEARGYKTTNKV